MARLQKHFEIAQAESYENIDDEWMFRKMTKMENELVNAWQLRNQFVRQKMRKNWIDDGERNSKFMHNLYRSRMNKSIIIEI